MSLESEFLVSLGQALASISLYGERHPARERALGESFNRLLDLTAGRSAVDFSFVGGETMSGARVLSELAAWDWAERFAAARVERIEIDAEVSRESYFWFVEEVFGQLSGRCVETGLARQMVRPPIRFGRLQVNDPGRQSAGSPGTGGIDPAAAGVTAAADLSDEVAGIRWIHSEVGRAGTVPMAEVEAVVRALAATIAQEGQVLLPLLTLKEYDQYTTTHACNVAVLSMGLAERLGFSAAEVRAIGTAGLLHDVGKVAIPHELLVKPGRYTEAEREIMQRHPVDGARMLMERERGLGLAAVVAYEHHVYLDGGGYPAFRFSRACHYASRIVHVCDIYDALCTNRPYRQAWEPGQALAYLLEKAGTELDPEIVAAFAGLIGEALITRAPVDEAGPSAAVATG